MVFHLWCQDTFLWWHFYRSYKFLFTLKHTLCVANHLHVCICGT
uniref:Uncharacterized protein n=1 Tax=Anguilla anguilla TaxID=7936 RepID=A0A0E9QHK8_ANGAN